MTKFPLQKGFTLVELIVSSSVLAILMLAAAAPFISMVEFRRNTSNQADINDNLKLIVSVIDKEVRTANARDSLFDICFGGRGVSFENQFGDQVRYEFLSTPDYKLVKTVFPTGYTVIEPCTDSPSGTEIYDLTSVDALYVQDVAFRGDGFNNDEPPVLTMVIEASSDEAGNENVVRIQNTTLLRNRAP